MEIDDQVDDRMEIDDVHDPMPIDDPMHINETEEDPIAMQIETKSLLPKRKRVLFGGDDYERTSKRANSISPSLPKKK